MATGHRAGGAGGEGETMATDSTHARRLDTPLPTYTTEDGRVITLVPISTERQARTFLVRWLVLYAMVKQVRDLDFIAVHEGKRRARAEGRKRGVFVD